MAKYRLSWLAVALIAASCAASDSSAPATRGDPVPSGFDIQGHRGARGLKPENTLPAFETALDLGVSTLEFDLHYTSDGEVVVWHDPVISPEKCGLKPGAPDTIPDPDDPDTPQESLALRSMTAIELGWFDCSRNPDVARFPEQDAAPTVLAGSDFGIVTLDRVFDFVDAYAASPTKSDTQRRNARAVAYNIETKRKPEVPATIGDGFNGTDAGPFELRILEVIEMSGLRDRVVIQSFDPRSLTAIHKISPDIRLAMLTTTSSIDLEALAQGGATIWSPNAQTLTERRITEVHAAGLAVIPWTVNEPDEMYRLIDAGVDGIITDRPDLILPPER